jgi:YVTN family beta-propeller protein
VIEEINPVTNTVLGNSTPIGTRLEGMAYDTTRHELFVVSQGNVLTTPPVVYSLTRAQGVQLPSSAVPLEIAYDKFNDQLYVTDFGSNQVTVINPNSLSIVKEVTVQSHPWGLSVDPLNGLVFVADYESDAISVISGTSVVASIPAGGIEPQGLAFDPINQMLYVSLAGSIGITMINATGNKPANYKVAQTTLLNQNIYGSPGAMTFDCTHNVIWVADTSLNHIYGIVQCVGRIQLFDQFQVLAPVPVGLQPQEMAYDNYTHGLYVTNYNSGTVTTYNTDTIKPAVTYGAGCPEGVADFGFNGADTYSYTTTRFESTTTFKSLTIGDSNIAKYSQEASDQLNVMTYGMPTSIANGIYWTQDVLSFNQNATCTSGTCFQLTSEIFNNTIPGSAISYKGAFAYTCNNHGTPGHVTPALETYYCDTKWEQGLTFPLTVKLLVETGTETSGKFKDQPYISFQYWLSNGPFPNQWIQFDRLHFNNVLSGHRINGNPVFKVDGKSPLTPYYSGSTKCGTGADGKQACPLMNDAENVICGYAGGAQVAFTDLSAKFQLEYWDGSAYKFIPHAFSSGADTGETAQNIYITGSALHFSGSSHIGADDAVQLY